MDSAGCSWVRMTADSKAGQSLFLRVQAHNTTQTLLHEEKTTTTKTCNLCKKIREACLLIFLVKTHWGPRNRTAIFYVPKWTAGHSPGKCVGDISELGRSRISEKTPIPRPGPQGVNKIGIRPELQTLLPESATEPAEYQVPSTRSESMEKDCLWGASEQAGRTHGKK